MQNAELETKNDFLALVRLGQQGDIACVEVSKAGSTVNDNSRLSTDLFRRGDRVVVELKSGQHVAEFVAFASSKLTISGRLLRLMQPDDELRIGHMQQFAQQALEKYNNQLTAHERQYSLLDAEPLMDGATLFLQFLQPDVPQEYTTRILAIYEEQARTSEFFRKVERGCGPACGTMASKSSCSSCVDCGTKCLPRRVRETQSPHS